MAENEVKVKFSQEGAEQVKQQVSGLQDVFGKLQGGIKGFSDHLKEAGGNTGLFSVGLDTLNQGLTIIQNPIAAVGSGMLALGKYLQGVANDALHTFQQMRDLQAVMGETADRSEDIANAFKLAGVETEKVGLAAFRMGIQLESGGKGLMKLGIDIRNTQGELKTEGELLLEVRDKISTIGDASTRSAALMSIFGRAGRSLAPAMALPREEFEKLIGVAEKYTAATPAFMEESKRTARAWEEVAQANEQVNSRLATTLALPVSQVFAEFAKAATQFKEAVLGIPFGIIGKILGIDQAQEMERQADVQKRLMEQAALVAKLKREGAEPKRLTEAESQELVARANSEFEMQSKRLKAEAQFETERLKIEEGAASKGIAAQRENVNQLVAMENERYQKTLEARKRTLLPGGRLDPREVEKMEREHQSRLLELEVEGKKLRLQEMQTTAQEERQVLEQSLRARQQLSERYLQNTQADFAREKAAVTEFAQNTGIQTSALYQMEIKNAGRVRDEKIRALNEEETALRAFADKYPQLYDVQLQVNQKLMDINQKRASASVEADQKIIASREQLLQKVKALADKEAGIGQSLEEKALQRLQARGVTDVSAADIAQERAQMGQEARETAASFAYGGTVDVEKLRESRQYGQTLAQMREVGTTGPQASAMFQSQQMAAYRGEAFRGIPSAMGGMADKIQALADQMKGDSDSAIEKLSGVISNSFQYFYDKLIRKMEFESARQ